MKVPRFWMALAVLGTVLVGMVSAGRAKASDHAAINSLEEELAAATVAKDMDRIMSFYVPDESLFVFDAIPPRQYVGSKAWRKNFEGFLANYPGPINIDLNDLQITTDGQLAFAHYVFHLTGTAKDGAKAEMSFRVTDCLQKMNGKWLIIHEHISFPVDLATGKADLLSKP
jgi:uncharacterized protein (TIGR02246 family)